VSQVKPIARTVTLGTPKATNPLQSAWVLRLVSVVSLVVVWVLLSRVIGSQTLPGPVITLEFLWQQLGRGALTFHIWATMQRVLIAFALSMVIGVALGVAIGAFKWLDRLLEAWLLAGLTIPRIMLFVMAYLLVGLNDTAAIVALILTVTPTIIAQLREGTRALDMRLIEMAKAYRRPPLLIWSKVILPQLLPYLIGTARGALSLAWKMVILAEILGRTSGVGYQISFYFQMFNMKGILAYGLAMMLVLALIDLVFMGVIQQRAFRWRKPVRLTE
jgi:ABC-type nitrate/sulfonate/bicarbonate transport system permease component